MGFLDLLSRKSATAAAMVLYRTGQAAPRVTDPRTLAKEGYQRNPDVLSAITQFTTIAKGIEWGLLRVSRRAMVKGWTPQRVRLSLAQAGHLGGGKAYARKQRLLIKEKVLEPVPEHVLLDLLAQPNPLQDWTDFIEALGGSYKLAGNSFLDMVGPDDPRKPPSELWLMRPDLTKIIVGDREMPIREYRYGTGVGEPRPPERVIHFKTWHPTDDFWGMPPLLAAARRIDWSNAAEDWNLSLMRNGGQRAGALKVEHELSEPQRKDLKEWVDTEYMGVDNVGRPLLLEGGMDWMQIAMTPEEASWLAGSEASTRKIAHVLNWPSILLGDSSDRTYSNYQEARKAGILDAVLPFLDMVRNKLNTRLVPRFGDDLLLTYITDDIEELQEDRDKLWARLDASVELTFDEKRIAKGYPELEGGHGNVLALPFSVQLVAPDQLNAPPPEPIEAEVVAVEDDPEQLDGKQVRPRQQLALSMPKAGKAWGLGSYDAKTEWWKSMEAQRERIAEKVEKDIARRFTAEARAVVDAMERASTPVAATIAAERALDAQQAEWVSMLRGTYLSVAEVFAKRVLDALTKGVAPSLTNAQQADDLWQRYAKEWLGNNLATNVANISDTTRVQLRSVLTEGIANGDSISELADRVKEVAEQMSSYRSKLIARNESLKASNLGQWAGAKSTGLPIKREWVATRDARVRGGHADADTQTVGVDESYTVDGESMMFPGDDSLGASPGNIIQCRCTEVYAVDEEGI